VHVFRLARLSGDVKGISRLDVVIIFFQNTILYHGFVSLGASNQPEDLALFFFIFIVVLIVPTGRNN